MKRYNPRKRIGGKMIRNSHYVWNCTHPDDPIVPGDGFIIHHLDGNKKNDDPDNLEKKLDARHRSDHSDHGVIALRKWRRENPEKAREQSRKNAHKCNKVRRRKKIYKHIKEQRRRANG